jgi:YHS domain-containing protein
MSKARISFNIVLAVITTLGVAEATALAQNHGGHRHDDANEGKESRVQPKCPVMDEPVDFFVKTMTADGPVYFCCKDCIKKFEANAKKYEKQVAEQRQALAKLPKVQVTCPVSGKPVDDKVFIEKDGKKTYFCCQGCIGKYEKDPGKYAAQLADSFSYQTTCPVMGEEIDPTAYIKLKTGQTVFFCCPGCDKKFLKDPAKYAPKLEAQGIRVDPKKVEIAAGPAEKGEHEEKEGQGGHEHGHDHDGHDH